MRRHNSAELGWTANIRRFSSVHCEHPEPEALADPMVHASRQHEAAECHTAKEMALLATTKEATDIALKKVTVFCEDYRPALLRAFSLFS